MLKRIIILITLVTLMGMGMTAQAIEIVMPPHYYVPDPPAFPDPPNTTPHDWPVFTIESPFIPLGAEKTIYIGAENIALDNYIKTGFFRVYYKGDGIFFPVSSKAGRTLDDGPYSGVSWTYHPDPDPIPGFHQLTVSFTILPQPAWEWFEFMNHSAPVEIANISRFYCNCTFIPVPPTLWLFGSGLVITGLIRVRKRFIG